MQRIPEIDRKIIYELIINSRQSFKAIGKKIRKSKNFVNYHVKKLEKQGVIKNYFTIIDIYKIGYMGLRIYTNLQYSNPITIQEMIQHFIKDKNVGVLYRMQGDFELDIIYWVKKYNEFFASWQKTLKLFCNYFQDPRLSFLHQVVFYDPRYLISPNIENGLRTTTELSAFDNIIKIDEIEYKILRSIAANARCSTTNLANSLNLTEEIVRYRIRKLKKLGVIKGFSTTIDISKIGYEWIAVNIDLTDYNDLPRIIGFFENNPNFIGIDMNSGYSHLQIEFHVKNSEQVQEIMNNLIGKFPLSIRRYSFMKPSEIFKRQYFPEN